jgi:hypothetical protein
MSNHLSGGVKLLWEGLRKSYTYISDSYILATDMSPEYLDRAKTAIYPRNSMREVPEAIRSTYFETFTRGRYLSKTAREQAQQEHPCDGSAEDLTLNEQVFTCGAPNGQIFIILKQMIWNLVVMVLYDIFAYPV